MKHSKNCAKYYLINLYLYFRTGNDEEKCGKGTAI